MLWFITDSTHNSKHRRTVSMDRRVILSSKGWSLYREPGSRAQAMEEQSRASTPHPHPPNPVCREIFPSFYKLLNNRTKVVWSFKFIFTAFVLLQIKNLNHNPVMAENPINCCGMGKKKMTLWNFMPGINPSFLITTNLWACNLNG